MKGGYSIVNCKGLDLGNVGKVTGIYQKMMTAYKSNKLVLAEGIVNGLAKFTPIPVFLATETSGNDTIIVMTLMNLPYRISPNDTIVQE